MSTVDEAKATLGVDAPINERALPSVRKGMHLGEPAYRQFSDEMIKLIGQTIMPKDYTSAELYQVLELAATYRLDPFTRELWAVKWSRNADAAVQVVVGRDGMLAIAERHDDFLGFRNESVYSNDTFEILEEQKEWKLPGKAGKTIKVPTMVRFAAKNPADRGELLGAFAEVYREGRAASFFFAPIADYDKAGSSDRSPWLKQKKVMIEKVALVTALRHAYRISGLYIMEELQMGLAGAEAAPGRQEAEESFWGDDEQVAQRLRDLFDALGYLPAKKRLLLQGLDDEGRLELVAKLEAECVEKEIELPEPPPEALVGEVVDDGEPEPEAAADPEWEAAAEEIPFGDEEQSSLLDE